MAVTWSLQVRINSILGSLLERQALRLPASFNAHKTRGPLPCVTVDPALESSGMTVLDLDPIPESLGM